MSLLSIPNLPTTPYNPWTSANIITFSYDHYDFRKAWLDTHAQILGWITLNKPVFLLKGNREIRVFI